MLAGQTDFDPDFEALLHFLRDARGFDFTGYKRTSLTRLVRRRMQAVGVTAFAEYVDLLEADPDEFTALFDGLLINVTGFYRDPEAWDALAERIVPDVVAAAGGPLRIWSAGCASGEEAYTLAMVFAEVLGFDALRDRVKIYATDVDERALAHGRGATYSESATSAVPDRLRERYFEPSGSSLVVRQELRRIVIFGRHDLIQDAPISRVRLIACRNTLMYLNHETQAQVLDRLNFALEDDGYLFLGKAEMLLSHIDLFTPVDLKRRLFRKVGRAGRRTPVPPPRTEYGGAPHLLQRLRRLVFDASTDAQLVLDPEGVLSLVNDEAMRTLGVTRFDVGRSFHDLELSYRPVELRSAIESVRTSGEPVVFENVTWRRDGGTQSYFVRVLRLVEADEFVGTALVFTEMSALSRLREELEQAHRQLESAYAELQSTSEELETTNEELQSTVEELETTNEELQSTNEELETMNEELQSANEEFQTINIELRERTSEVNEVNAFLQSILGALQKAVVVVDRDLVVRLWNDGAERLWGLRAHEAQGEHLLNLDVGLPVEDLRRMLRTCLTGSGDAVSLVVPAINRRGRRVDCDVVCSPLHRGVEVTGALVLMHEVEEAP